MLVWPARGRFYICTQPNKSGSSGKILQNMPQSVAGKNNGPTYNEGKNGESSVIPSKVAGGCALSNKGRGGADFSRFVSL